MAVLKVAHLGHPILRQVAEPVSPEAIAAPEIQRLIDRLGFYSPVRPGADDELWRRLIAACR